MREVAVYDTINPGGFYAARLKLLGSFAAGQSGCNTARAQDVADPLYGNIGGARESDSLAAAIAQMRSACAGLLTHLLELEARCDVARGPWSYAPQGSHNRRLSSQQQCAGMCKAPQPSSVFLPRTQHVVNSEGGVVKHGLRSGGE